MPSVNLAARSVGQVRERVFAAAVADARE